jgi:ketosteroid isomerase-like protein
MSNLDIALRHIDATQRQDAEALEEMMAPDAVWDLSRSRGPYRGVYEGEEIRTHLLALKEAWEEIRAEPFETYEKGSWLAMGIRARMRGRGSGVELEAQGARVYEFREGKIARFILCQDLDEAKAVVDDAQP